MRQTCPPSSPPPRSTSTGPSLHIGLSTPAGGLCWVTRGQFALSIEQSVSHTAQHLCPTQHEPDLSPDLGHVRIPCLSPNVAGLLFHRPAYSQTSSLSCLLRFPGLCLCTFRDIGFLKRSVGCRSACPLACPALFLWSGRWSRGLTDRCSISGQNTWQVHLCVALCQGLW